MSRIPRSLLVVFIAYFSVSVLLLSLGIFADNSAAMLGYYFSNLPTSGVAELAAYLVAGFYAWIFGDSVALTVVVVVVVMVPIAAIQSAVVTAICGLVALFFRRRKIRARASSLQEGED